MHGFFLALLGAVALGVGASAPIEAQPGARVERPTALVEALRAARIAEVYIVRRELEYPMSPTADTVKAWGCRYVFVRYSRAWDALEAALQDVEIGPNEEARWSPHVRLGLLLGDDRGSLFEVYARWPDESEAFVPGLVQRRSARISARFAAALERVTLSHPENMVRIESPMRICPSRRAETERP